MVRKPVKRARQKPNGYWKHNLEREVRAFIAQQGTPGVMPSRAQLLRAGRTDLHSAIQNYGGGLGAVAKRLRLKTVPRRYNKPRGYWDDAENFEQEFRAFIADHGQPGIMPVQGDMLRAGRYELVSGVIRQGGFSAVAKRFGLKRRRAKRPNGYWDKHLEQELRAFIRQHGRPGVMPSLHTLNQAGRSDLAAAIKQRGGDQKIARRLGLKFKYIVRPPHFWDDFKRLEQELRAFMKEAGRRGALPTISALEEAGRHDLLGAIYRWDGVYAVARRMGVKPGSGLKPKGYWKDWENVARELRAFMTAQGSPRALPPHIVFIRTRRSDLLTVIDQHGGMETVTKRLGVSRLRYLKPKGYWDNPENLKRELEAFSSEHGMVGWLPTPKTLHHAGRSDLAHAITRCGGFAATARRFKLVWSGKHRPPGYWKDFANLKRELLAFIAESGQKGRMPSKSELDQAGSSRLTNAIQLHGGFTRVAGRLRLGLRPESRWGRRKSDF